MTVRAVVRPLLRLTSSAVLWFFPHQLLAPTVVRGESKGRKGLLGIISAWFGRR